MVRPRRVYAISLSALMLLTCGVVMLLSQTTGRELIHAQVNETRLVTLPGNTRPEVATGTDLGAVPDDFALNHMMLQLKRSPEQEKEVEQFNSDLQNRESPNFHRFLTPTEFGKRFGAAEADIRAISLWLQSHGFKVNAVYPNGMVIDFSGNAGQVLNAFHTSIHRLNVNGVNHIANMTDPQIPEALAPVVAGVVSLHDFPPQKMSRLAKPNRAGAQYTYSGGTGATQAMVPADLATIYDFNPLFSKGITGKGQTIVAIEDTNLYSSSDWTTFRTVFGLAQYTTGTLTTVQPGGAAQNCTSPGVNSDDIEAELDVEWASAAAPGAAIEMASCADTATFGVFVAAQNVINSTPAPAIVSISYGECETMNGAASNAALNSLFQQAATQGTSVFVSAGDAGAAGCDQNATAATHGIGVSAFASTPYNVAVGGTDFSDVYSGTVSKYWSNSNTSAYGSALSYIPEIPWNDSCAGSLLSSSYGYSTTYGASGFCATTIAQQNFFLNTGGGSGGPSGCATGNPATYGIVGGTCQGYAKPSWQTGLAGIPNDGVRDIPDVSMFASDGTAWGRYSVICFSDPNNSGVPCRGAPDNWIGIGGTSLAAPVMAGVQALINQSVGSTQGNPNSEYYHLASKVPSVFHSITTGDNDVNCEGTANCFGYVGTIMYGRGGRLFGTTFGGVLSSSTGSYQPAYSATSGTAWNFATGIGSVDVNNLVTNWGK